MTTMASDLGELDVLRRCVEPAVAQTVGADMPILAVRWERFDLATSYDARLATVELVGGGTLRLFVKDYGHTVRPKEEPKHRREREVRTYRDLLVGTELETAHYYGSLLDESERRLWLVLEYVDGTPVGYLDIAAWWPAATAALGRLHGYFASRTDHVATCEFIVHHTPDFFWSKVDLASRAVSELAPDLGDSLTRIVKHYAPIVQTMSEQPRTLIHGGCRSTNILVKIASQPSRACIIDWEETAYGAPLYDIAYLLDGIESPTLDPLLEAYRRAAANYRLSLPPWREAAYIVDCFRLHMILTMLGQAVVKRYTRDGVAKLLAIGSRLSDALGGWRKAR
jgi:aminoglycoside phosphotransferase (APT) family kinase protein